MAVLLRKLTSATGATRVAVGVAVGGVLGGLAVWARVAPSGVVGLVLGAMAAIVVQRIQLAHFSATVKRSEGSEWIDRLPTSLAALRRPMRAIAQQVSRRSDALHDATARDRIREVTVDALELELDAMHRTIGETQANMAEVLATLDRALVATTPQAVLRRELVELREFVKLSVLAELPSDVVPLGDVVASVVAAGVPRGRVQVADELPYVTAPGPLVEALVRALMGHALAVGEHIVTLHGALDGGMVVVEVKAPSRAEPTIHLALARRAAHILGGDLQEKPDGLLVVFPARFVAGLRALSPQPVDWDAFGLL